MDIKLTKSEYNLVFSFLAQNAFAGGHAVAADKLVEQIRAGADEGKAEDVTIKAEPYELEAVMGGLLAFVEANKLSSNDLGALKEIARILKVKKAFGLGLDKLVPKESTIEIDSEIVLDD
jgi:hypothetical protein